MPVGNSQRNPQSETPDHQSLPVNSKATHIRNKDGTKLITVPSRKVSTPDSPATATSATPATTITTSTASISTTVPSAAITDVAPSPPLPFPPSPPPPPTTASVSTMDYSNGVNTSAAGKKKRKNKRGKQAPQSQHHGHQHDYGSTSNGAAAATPPPPNHPHHYQQDIRDSMADFDDHDPPELVDPEDDEEYYSDQDREYDDNEPYSPPPPTAPAPAAGKSRKGKKKSKKKAGGNELIGPGGGGGAVGQVQTRKGKDRIWNTSTTEERERIKDFWLSLGEEERRSLVKVEKEAVLRKMKEQQKHSCSCSVCGRKRTAIEEELEVLYDAYYEELEQYANQQQTNKYLSHVPPSPPSGTFPSSIPPPPPPPPPPGAPPRTQAGSLGQGVSENKVEDDEDFEDDDDEEEEYEDDDEVLDHALSPPPPQNDPRPDFFNFGNSLTVQGGILTVADDLLKNDGKKFIEMMEQLAERRMAREEEVNNANGVSRDANVHHQHVHNHTQPSDYDDEEYDDEEDEDEDYEEDEEEDEEPDTMTEEQRMEEGRRMFQIFAARMFEQRVLQAYREKVAEERQKKLLQELADEDRRKEEREAKKAQDKDKKREKKRQAKQAKEEERLRKEAEKRQEEAKQKELDAKRAEEQRRRRDEQRLKREAERKAAEEEKQRKEEEKRRRQQEEKEREAERERKRKEHQERERKKREELAKKQKEEKEARERELREKREREDRENREREAKAKKDAMEKEKKRREEEAKARAGAAIAATKRAQAFAPIPSMPHAQNTPPPGYGSPHLPVITPATPKQSVGPQLHRPRNSSQQSSMQGSQGSSPKTPNVAPRLGTTVSPSTPTLQQNMSGGPVPIKGFQFPGFPPASPMPHNIGPPPGVTPPDGGFSMPPMGLNGPNPMQPFLASMPQRQNGIPMFTGQMPLGSPQYRGFASSNGLPIQAPPAPGMRPIVSQGRGMFVGDMPHQLPPGVPLPPPGSPFGTRVEPVPMSGHSRIPSGSFDAVHRPTPIQRPSSVAPPRSGDDQVDELSKVMGSRALLEDDDDPLPENMSPSRRVSGPQFAPRPIRSVGSPSIFGDSLGGFNDYGASWSNPLPLGGNLSGSLPSAWANKAGWSDIDAGAFNRRRTTRIDQIRMLACQKFRELSGPNNQPVEISTLQRAVQAVAPPDLHFVLDELTHTLDVEGDSQNGGGSFDQRAEHGRILVYYAPDEFADLNHHGPIRAGEIGSPSTTGAVPFKTPLGGPPGMTSGPAEF